MHAGPRTRGIEAGYSLVEVLVSLAVITITMTAFTTFVIAGVTATSGQGTKQTAVQYTDDAIDQVRAVTSATVIDGRDEQSTRAQWAAGLATPAIAAALNNMTWTWDADATYPAGATATLPTTPTTNKLDGVDYARSWYVGTCWRPAGDDASCVAAATPGATEFVRVVAAVTWSDRNCAGSACSYVASTLISAPAPDPVFTPEPTTPGPTPTPTPAAAPSGGSVDATGLTGTGTRYSTSSTLHLVLNKGSATVGLAPTGARLYRATATFISPDGSAQGVCGTYGPYVKIGSDDPPATLDDIVTDQHCYRYQYVVANTFGDSTTYTSGDIKVDTTAPDTAPTLTLAAVTGTTISGTVVYYRPGATTGSFTVVAAATDGGSGIASYSFPNLGIGWSAVPGVTGTMTYSWAAPGPAAPVGAQNVTAINHAGVASAATGFTLVADSTGPAGGSVDATSLTGTGTRYSTTTALTIALAKGTDAHGLAPTGADLQRLSAPLTSAGGTANGTCGTYTSAVALATDPATPMPDTVADQICYQYLYTVSDVLGNLTTYSSGDVKIDTTAPSTPDLVFSAMTNSSESNGTVYLTGTSGSFTVTASATDSGSGIASYAFPSLGAGWTATPGVLGVMTYSWSGTPTPAAGLSVTATNNATLASPAAMFSTVANTSGPTGGSVTATGLTGTGTRYSTTTALSITLNKGTDPDGLGTALLYRATATLTAAAGTANGACGTYGGYALVTGGTNPASPKADTVADQACYRYQYVVADALGNQTTYTSADIKVDTTAPTAPTLTLAASANTYVSGSTVYYRSTATSGSFSLTAATTDAASGVLSYSLPALGAGWTGTAGGTGVITYSWASAGPAAPGAKTVTATNNAFLVSATAGFTPTADVTAPAGGSVSYTNGYLSTLSVAVTFAAGTDGGAGINATGGTLQRATATLTDGVCGTFTAFSNLATNPTSPYTDGSLTGKTCYMYRYLATDRVGNQATYTSASVAKLDYSAAIDATAGVISHWRLGDIATTDAFTGTSSTDLSTHTDANGYSWTKRHSVGGNNVIFTNTNRIRKSGTLETDYVSSAIPTTPDYGVEADLIMRSSLPGDVAGVEARAVDSNNYYFARYNRDGTCWTLYKSVGGVTSEPSTYVQTLTIDQSYRLRLEVNGTSITLSVDGVVRLSMTDSGVTAPGRAGVRFGGGNANTSPTNSTGMQLDNFAMTPITVDSKGVNDGDYLGSPTYNVTGAIADDPNPAVRLDGSADYASVPDAASLDLTDGPLTIEAWVKRADNGTGTQTILQKGTGTYQFAFKNNKIGLYKYGTATAIAQSTGTLTDMTGFHHVVATKTGATSKIYVDGFDVTAAGTNQTLVNTTSALTIGGSSGERLNGTLDEVAVYNQVLSAGAVADHYLLGTGVDVAGPSGGSVDASGLAGTGTRYSTSTSLSVAFSPGVDVSGLAATGRKLLRATATLTNGTCGTYGAYTQVGADDPVSPKADAVADNACYSYRYVVADLVGNSTTYASGDVKVDSTAPAAPSVTLSAPNNAYITGSTVYYRSTATSGSFTAAAATTDATAGIAAYTFGSAGAGWTITGSGASRTYSWAAASPTTSNPTIGATNNAGAASPGTAVTLTADASAPSGGSVSYPNGGATSSTVTVTLVTGSDTGSGLDTAAAVLQRSAAPYAGGSCGTYAAFTTLATAPTSPYPDAGLGSGCYKYRYVVADRVGNSTTYTSANVAQVDYASIVQATAGVAGYWRMGVAASSADSFTDTAGTAITSHTGEVAATWTKYGGSSNAVISDAGRLRKTGTSEAAYYSSYVPASANYAVEMDITVKSNINDIVAVNGRRDPTAGSATSYYGRFNGGSDAWEILKNISGTATTLDTSAQNLTVGGTYRMRLDMNGSALKLYVDGVLVCSATDSSISAAGRGAVHLGASSTTATTDTTGYHVDNFRIVPNTGSTMTATVGANGTVNGSPLLNTVGAIGDFNSATQWISSSSYADVPDSAALDLTDGPLSLEAWVRRGDNGTGMQTILQKGTGAYQFGFLNNKIGLYKYTGSGAGTVIAQSVGTQLDTAAYHHYVITKSAGAVKIYVDGADVTGTVTNQTLVNTAAVLRVGGGSATERLNGYEDEVAVYNQVLTPATVTDHYLIGSGASGSGSALGGVSAQAGTVTIGRADAFTAGIRVTGPAAIGVQRRSAVAHPRRSRGR